MSKIIKSFRFLVSKAPEKIDREIQDWAKENGMKEVKRSSYTAFQFERKDYLICVCEFKKTKEAKRAARELIEERLEGMFD